MISERLAGDREKGARLNLENDTVQRKKRKETDDSDE